MLGRMIAEGITTELRDKRIWGSACQQIIHPN